MRIGITGTRDGMTEKQRGEFERIIGELWPFKEWHHGDCIGVDSETTNIIYLQHDFPSCFGPLIICHPPQDEKLRAFNPHYDVILPSKTHFARNRDIVDNSDLVIVIPKQMSWQKFGGTWMTHDYAIKKKKQIIIIWPDGTSKNI